MAGMHAVVLFCAGPCVHTFARACAAASYKHRVHGPEDENASKRGQSEGRVHLPISEKDEVGAAAAADRERSPRGMSVPPRGKIVSIVRSTLSAMTGSANKKVTIDNSSPIRHSPQSSAMAESPADQSSAETEFYPRPGHWKSAGCTDLADLVRTTTKCESCF